MASVSLVSSPPVPVFDKNMTDSELAGDEREDGELEDGEIDDEGIGIEEENKEAPEVFENEEKQKEKERDKEKEKSHRHSRKRYKKTKEKRRSKRRRRDRQKHHSSSSSSSSDSYDSDYDRPGRPKNRPSHGSGRDCDVQNVQHGRDQKGSRGSLQKSPPHKNSNFDKYSDYSDDNYDYEDEEDPYDGESEYMQSKDSTSGPGKGRYPKEQMGRRGNMRGLKQFGQRGRGRGIGSGRGRGSLNKKIKGGKPWMGRGGRGRGVDQDMEDIAPEVKNSGFQKKRLVMSKEFISQHTVEHNGRYICKYFLEGRCIKGEQCKFEHELVIPDKKKELCKFYLQGYCSKGDHCIYMHSEYPCKFFHTGAKCYQGENCKFSHDDLTDVTKELLNKIINTEEENAREDELELEDLRKQGIAPLPKPPPGVGLLPTPGHSSPTDDSSQAGKIPSIFEISVQPTVDLAHKIGLNESNCPDPNEDTDQFSGRPEETQSGALVSPGSDTTTIPSLGPPGTVGYPTGPPMSAQSPPGQQMPHGYPMQQPIPSGQTPVFHGNTNCQRPPFPAVPELQMLQSLFPFPPVAQNPLELLNNLLQKQSVSHQVEPGINQIQNLQQQIPDVQLQSLPSAVQKAIILHLTQQQAASKPCESNPQGAESQDDRNTNRDEITNWYSSDEEGGSSVTSILKSLKRQTEMQQSKTTTPVTTAPLGDPRLVKERTQPSDPRVKADPRQRPPDMKKESDAGMDPRLSRDPRKPRHVESSSYRQQNQSTGQKKLTGDEDEEGERELRDRAVLIPLEASPGVMLRDPRCQLKQFSHIRVDILLQRPAFALTVVWAPEDLIPSPIPKQEHSINLPLPPLIADAQMNRTSVSDHSLPTSPTLTDPRLAAARLKERFARLPSGSSMDRPVDPRQIKNLDPRLKRTGSLDSKLPGQKEAPAEEVLEPELQKTNISSSLSERLPPYAPRLASSGGVLESPTRILGGISLYDPRNQTEPFQKDQVDPPRRAGILKHPVKKDTPPTQPASPSHVSQDETKNTEAASNHNQTVRDSSPPPHQDCISTPHAVHNLPVQAVAGLIRPQYAEGRQAKLVGPGSAEVAEEQKEQKEVLVDEPKQMREEELEDRTLKEVFKTFDPTASPFSQ
ncbi:zinc finger CCCH domain-containing protein 6 isoform X1 [Corythoichthys intestinalis]|uniref:zinc finger CCCH domain-containing protein 6 isoform X1 n=1 Tax=Corythoichthys intestinalis TaxID=161448 RepID=UPI0025A6745A|nr:zinc finger CCCH domain-containing protein 6 isoform X1 [Corythoichthys intestinalis]